MFDAPDPLRSAFARLVAETTPELHELRSLAACDEEAELKRLFTLAPRLVGKRAAPDIPLASDELVRRMVLLRAGAALSPDRFVAFVDECYRHGEGRERAAVLRALPHLRAPDRFLALAADACRSHMLPVFEAIACENEYPVRYFDPSTFRQLVLKAIFVEVPVARIAGVFERTDAELARMAEDYAAERRAAGRPVPADCDLLIARGRAR